MKLWIGSLLLAGLSLPLSALAQDDTPAPGPKQDDSGEKRVGVIVVQEDDGEGPSEPKVIILEGDELDGFDLPLPHEGAGTMERARLRIRGEDGEDFELELDGEHDLEGFKEQMQAVRKRLKKVLGDKAPQLGGMLDPEKLTARIEKQIARTRTDRTKRVRDDALRALEVDEEVAAVVGPLLDRVLEARRELERGQAQRRKLLRKDLSQAKSEAGLQELLAGFRDSAKQARQTLTTAREKLREILTIQQELELVVREILD